MKAIKLNKIVYLFFAGLLLWSCGEERVIQDYDVYNQVKLLDDDGTVSYDPVVTYPINGIIASGAAYFDMTGTYRFGIDEKILPAGSTANVNNFSIDGNTGVIEYKNSGELSPGMYYVSVRLENINGVAVYNQVYEMTVNEVPVSLQIDNEEVEAGIFEEGVMATLSYTDESGAGEITSVIYSLVDSPVGFSIDADSGEISKVSGASSGENKISVKATTNLGAVVYEDILTVIVGAEPTIVYVQQDGATPLSKATISPWTAYTTAAPILDGMTATSYEIVLPETLVTGAVTIDATGKISVAADQNLAIGDYLLGVIASNDAGKSFEFNDVFVLTVDTRWEMTDLFNDTFDDGLAGFIDPGNTMYPDFSGYSLGAGTNAWAKAVIAKAGRPTIEGIRVQNPGTNHHYLVRTIDITGVKAMKVSFGEQSGYNDKFIGETYSRGLYAGETTTDLEAGSFNPASWTNVMAPSDPRWPGTATWSSRVPNDINDISVDLSNIAGTTLKLAWYIGGDTAQNGQYAIDYCNAQVSVAFPAEEE